MSDTVKLSVKNVSANPCVVHTAIGSRVIPIGQTLEADFTSGEAIALARDPAYEVTGIKTIAEKPKKGEKPETLPLPGASDIPASLQLPGATS